VDSEKCAVFLRKVTMKKRNHLLRQIWFLDREPIIRGQKEKEKKEKIYELLSNNKDYENEDMMMYEQNLKNYEFMKKKKQCETKKTERTLGWLFTCDYEPSWSW